MIGIGSRGSSRQFVLLTGSLVVVLATSCGESSREARADAHTVPQKSVSTKTSATAPQAKSPDYFLACFKDVRSRDVEADVQQDAARGERRFFLSPGWEETSWPPGGIRSCTTPPEPDRARRPIAVSGYTYAPREQSTLPGNACSAAISNYIVDYNQTMAELLPASLIENCPSGHARVDRSYRPIDLDLYARMLRLKAKNVEIVPEIQFLD
jgi:hypothetical protein